MSGYATGVAGAAVVTAPRPWPIPTWRYRRGGQYAHRFALAACRVVAVIWRNLGESIVFLAGVLGALGVLWRYGAGMLRRVGKHLNAELSERLELAVIAATQPVLIALADMEPRLKAVVKDGIEYRDRLDKIEREQREQRAILAAHIRHGHVPE